MLAIFVRVGISKKRIPTGQTTRIFYNVDLRETTMTEVWQGRILEGIATTRATSGKSDIQETRAHPLDKGQDFHWGNS